MAVVIKIKVRIPEWLDRICAWPVTAYRCRKYGHSFRRIGLPDRQYAIVDEKDFYQLNNYEWFAKGFSGLFYAIRFDNSNKKETKIISMHREIMNDPAGYMVDHRNCDTFDNRRDNLRLATRFQNGCNSRQDKSKTSSRYRGVHKIKKTGRWAANIRVNGKKTWLGSFETEIEAARAYDAAARKYHGEFARLNFP